VGFEFGEGRFKALIHGDRQLEIEVAGDKETWYGSIDGE
jgi:hypothetical protein